MSLNHDLINRIVRLIPPYRVAQDAGVNIRREVLSEKNSAYYTRHPKLIGERLYISDYEFIEARKGSGFFGGNVFDFLALIEGSLESAVDVFFERYRYKIAGITAFEEAYVKDYLVKTARRMRVGFDWLNKLITQQPDLSRFHSLLSWQRHHQIVHQFTNHWMYFAEASTVVQLLEQLYPTEADYPFEVEEGGVYCVTPYYSSWSNISHIVFEIPTEGRRFILDINPAGVSWAGLHGALNYKPFRPTHFYSTQKTALTMQSYFRDRLEDVHCLHAEVRKNYTDNTSIRFEYGTCMLDKFVEVEALAATVRTINAPRLQYFENFNAKGSTLKWEQYVVQEITSLVQADGISSPAVAAYISVLNLTFDEVQEVRRLLTEVDPTLSGLVSNWQSSGVYKFKGCEVEETPYGYVATYPDRTDRTLLTNFTIDIERSLILTETGQVILLGSASLNELKFGFELDKKFSTNLRAIEDAVLQGFNRWLKLGLRGQSDQRVPTICDPAQAKILTGILGQKCAQAVFDEGFTSLGWVGDGKFVAPFWTKDETTLNEGQSHVLASSIEQVNCFRFSRFPTQFEEQPLRSLGNLPIGVRAILQTLTAWLVRGSYGYTCEPMMIKDSLQTRNILKAVCSVFGQVSPLMLNPSARRGTVDKLLPGFKSLPIYTHSNNPQLLSEVKYPMWILGDEGLAITTIIGKADLNKITQLTYILINRVLDWLAVYGQSKAVSFDVTVESQQQEAKNILAQVQQRLKADCVFSAVIGSTSTSSWRRVLAPKTIEHFKNWIEQDRRTGMYRMFARQKKGLPHLSVSLRDLAKEARLQGMDVEREGSYYWIPQHFIEDQLIGAGLTGTELRAVQKTS